MKKAKIAQAPRGGHPPPPYGGLESLRGLQLAETSRFSLVDICQPCQLVTPSGSSTCLLVAATKPRPLGGSLSGFSPPTPPHGNPKTRSPPPPPPPPAPAAAGAAPGGWGGGRSSVPPPPPGGEKPKPRPPPPLPLP